MKPVISPVQDPLLQKNFSSIRECLGGKISFDNMNYQVIEGTTSSDVDSQSKIIHSMSPRPSGWFPLVGDIYVQEISDQHIDVRSTKPSVNFKIILIGGPNVVGEAVAEVGPSSYRTTTQVVQETPAITITNITDATVTIEPTIVQSSVFPAPGTSDISNQDIGGVIMDANYIYVTQSLGGGSAGATLITRYNRVLGTKTAIDTGHALGVCAMYYTDPYLYVSCTTNSGGTVTVYRILLSTFAIDATITFSMAISRISDIYVDGTNIYLAGCSSGTGAGNSILGRVTLAGTGPTTLTLGSTGTRVATRILSIGNDLWVSEASTLATSSLFRVLKSAFTLTSTHTTANRRLQFNNMVATSDAIWLPAACDTGKTATTEYTYGAILYRFDLTQLTYSEFPIPFVSSESNNDSNMFISQIIETDGFLYLYSVSSTSASGVYITRFDTLDNSMVSAWYPWKVPASFTGPTSNTHGKHNNLLTQDMSDMEPACIWSGTTPGTDILMNFQFFKPDFSVFG